MGRPPRRIALEARIVGNTGGGSVEMGASGGWGWVGVDGNN